MAGGGIPGCPSPYETQGMYNIACYTATHTHHEYVYMYLHVHMHMGIHVHVHVHAYTCTVHAYYSLVLGHVVQICCNTYAHVHACAYVHLYMYMYTVLYYLWPRNLWFSIYSCMHMYMHIQYMYMYTVGCTLSGEVYHTDQE